MMRVALLLVCVPFVFAESATDRVSAAVGLLQARRYEPAALNIRDALKQFPDSAELWNLLGICESELKNVTVARSAFEHGLTLAPGAVGLNENLGLLFFQQNDYTSAKLYLLRALKLGSTNAGVRYSLAAARIRTGDRTSGAAELVALEQELAKEPDYWSERGWVEIATNPAAAAGSFDRALAIAPQDVRALNGAASAAEALQNDERAR